MQRNSLWFGVLLAVVSGGVHGQVHAQQLRPYFLVIVDTSGSMAWCASGSETQLGRDDCSCHTTPTNCDSPFKQNRCGFPANRLGDARCALQRIIDGTGGDATFGLMQFEHPCSTSCGDSSVTQSGTACGISCSNGGAACDDAQLVVDIKSGNDSAMREWVDGTCQGSCTNNYTRELTAGVWTPLAKSLQRANEYLRGAPGAGFLYPTNPAGFNVAPSSPLAGDPQLACRPVSVILLTDGKDTCAGNPQNDPPAAATALNTGDVKANNVAGKAFRTYVIGFGAAGNFDPVVLDNVAMNGGTDSHDASNHKYFPASNEAQLSLALNKIIADSQPPIEVCNEADDDCDGKVDEGLPKYCDKPNGVNDPTLCMEPPETVCDGKDDNCNGVIDEGLTNACGVCGPLMQEICDNLDNDCDGRIDEDTNTLSSCGNSKGECQPGKLVCSAGMPRCEGAIGGMPEICDCKDNDCDGITDEEGTPSLCGDGKKCAGCKCVEFCLKVSEFNVTCPENLAPEFQPNGECLCIVDKCDHKACPASTIERDGVAVCAPNDPRTSECVCQAGTCVPRCDGVSCSSGQICSPKTGHCVEDNCRGLGCVSGELCDPVAARCVKDLCASLTCNAGQVCRAGMCEPSCSNVTCKAGESCQHGSCVANKCADHICEPGLICDPSSGECGEDRCASVVCEAQQACSPSSGACVADPCWNVSCPKKQICIKGECMTSGATPPPATQPRPSPPSQRLTATGGGGCSCSVPGPARGSVPRGLWLALTAFALLALRTRRSWTRALGWLLITLSAAALGACHVSPICLDCVDGSRPGADGGGQPAADGGNEDSAVDGMLPDAGAAGMHGDAATDGALPEDGGPPKCTPTGDETCNGKDDDCDFKVDEDVTPRSNDCSQVGVCAGTLPTCSGGKFVCRYGAATYESTETLCDGLDNDCNGMVDEPFKDLNTKCEVGIGTCRVSGKLRCNSAGTGLQCDVKSVGQPSEEVCNGKDDDCDGMVDEPKAMPGSNPSYVKDDMVKLKDGLWIYAYEASRVDADASNEGIVSTRTCSRAGVLPWSNITYTEAESACQSIGMTLCNLDDWLSACRGASGNCNWSFTPADGSSCNSYSDDVAGKRSVGCNGHDITTAPGGADRDALKASGAKSECFADFGNAGKVFDLSGNAKEWTVSSMSPDQNPLRGGSYNNTPTGLRCDFDYTVGAADLRLPNIGFRCCSNSEP